MLRALLTFILLTLAFAVQGELYRWTGADGKVHYSDTPPPDNAVSKRKMELKLPPVSDSARSEEGSAKKSLADQVLEMRVRRLAAEEAEKKELDEAKLNKAKCTQASYRLNALKDAGRISRPNEQGEKIYIDDIEREKVVSEARRTVAYYCK